FTNAPGTYSYALLSTGRDATYVGNYTVTAANIWTRVKVPSIPALPTGTGATQIGTWNFSEGQTGLYIVFPFATGANVRTATLNSWQAGQFMASTTSGNLCTVTTNQLKISGVKLEASAAVSYLSVPSFDQDFLEAVRYYYTTFDYQSTNSGLSITFNAQAAAGAAGRWPFARRMAKVPTVVPYSSTTFAAGNLRNLTTSTDLALANLSATRKGAYILTTSGGGAKGDVLAAIITADARLS